MEDMNMAMDVVVMKVCSKCKDEKELNADNFPRNKTSKDGYSHWCKQCHSNHRKSKSKKSAAPVVAQAVRVDMDPTDV